MNCAGESFREDLTTIILKIIIINLKLLLKFCTKGMFGLHVSCIEIKELTNLGQQFFTGIMYKFSNYSRKGAIISIELINLS